MSATTFDMANASLRDLNSALHDATDGEFLIENPRGAHAIGAGIRTKLSVTINGPVGYYCAGMNQFAMVRVNGNASAGLAENIMSGVVHVTGSATMSAGASGHGGLVVVEGNAGSRCGISMKGVDIVVGGNVGHMSCFMAQSGNLVVLGDAGADLGDSLYETDIFVRGSVESLGSDCVEKVLRPEDLVTLERLLSASGLDANPSDFSRYGSARQLYNFHIDDIDAEVAETARGAT